MPENTPWWRHAVVYQVYVRSFADGNGDGTGDIAGLRSRLPYLRSLGVDAIWVNPWYESPLNDGGYDVADYREIHPQFGTLEEAKLLIEDANQAGIRVLVDLVPNHTSNEHRWFEAALAAGPGSSERDRYHFLPGRGEHGELPPNDWKSVFGGPAWTKVPDDEWYLHLFDTSQPDLNWSNQDVREEFDGCPRYGRDRGAAGFRVDVPPARVKPPAYPDVGEDYDRHHELSTGAESPMWDRDGLHEIVRRWRSVLDEYDDTVMIAEAWVPSWDRLSLYLRPDEYHQAFDFHFLGSEWDPSRISSRIKQAVEKAGSVGAVPTWVLSNHDVVRHATRYALPNGIDSKHWLLDGDRSILDTDRGHRRARAAALLMLALPGSVYLYQGEELGLPEVHELPTDVLDDPVWERSGHSEKGRDGCRVPIPWSKDGSSFGFGEGGSWLPQPEWWGDYAVEAQDGIPGSTLELYRDAMRLRDEHLRDAGDLTWLDDGDAVLSFQKGDIRCMVNFGDPIGLPDGEVLLASEPSDEGRLPTDAAVWIKTA